MRVKLILSILFELVVFAHALPIMAFDLSRIEVVIPSDVSQRDSIDVFNSAVFWSGVNQIVVVNYNDSNYYLIDIQDGKTLSVNPIGGFEGIKWIDRKKGTIAIQSGNSVRYDYFLHDPADTDPPDSCTLSYEYHGAPKRKSTFNFARVTPEGQSSGMPRLVNEIFPPGELADPGPMNVVDCLRGGEIVLLSAVYESLGGLYYAELNDLYLLRIRYLGLYGAQAFFLNNDKIISLKHNDEIETEEGEPNIYYPVILSTEGAVVFEDRSIRLIQAARVFDYDPVTKRVVAFIQGSTRTSSTIAIFQVVE